MSSNVTGNHGGQANASWLHEEIKNKDEQITQSWQSIVDLEHTQVELERTLVQNNDILIALAVKEEILDEKQNKILETMDHLEAQMKQIKKRDRKTQVNAEQEARSTLQVMPSQEAQVQPILVKKPQNREAVPSSNRVWEGIKEVFLSIGRCCRNNRRLFEAVAGIAGIVLAICFAFYAIPILLCVGGGIAFFDWITG